LEDRLTKGPDEPSLRVVERCSDQFPEPGLAAYDTGFRTQLW
jgi:hypothetical protein